MWELKMRKLLISGVLLILSININAHKYSSFEEISAAFGFDFENIQIQTKEIAPGVYKLVGAGGNIIASIGDQGVLIVDSQFPQMIPKIKKAIENIGGNGIDFAINTHWHFDHADGNPTIGRDGTWIVAQEKSRRMMMNENPIDLVRIAYMQPKMSKDGIPVITFEDKMKFHFNNQTIHLFNFGPAHTTGDTAVYFEDANVIHMGDVFNENYPFIDSGNGGSIVGMINFCKSVLKIIDEDTLVVPGHGGTKKYSDLMSYTNMLETISSRISAAIEKGMTIDQVVASRPTSEFDEEFGDPLMLINRAYRSLARQ